MLSGRRYVRLDTTRETRYYFEALFSVTPVRSLPQESPDFVVDTVFVQRKLTPPIKYAKSDSNHELSIHAKITPPGIFGETPSGIVGRDSLVHSL